MPKILIVDDDPDFVEVIRTILEAKDYHVNSASDSKEAVKVIHQQKPDLVLLDIMMASVLDGLSVTYEMHDDPELHRIPIIVVSSIAQSDYAGQFPTDEYIHIDDWLSKPIQPDALLDKVKMYLLRSKR